MAMNGPQNSTEEVVAETTVEVPAPKKQVASKTHYQTAKEFSKSKKEMPKEAFIAKNKSAMEDWRAKFEDTSSEMTIDEGQPLTEYPVKLQKAVAPEKFEGGRKEWDQVAEELFEDFANLNLVESFPPQEPQEPQKPVIEKPTQSSTWSLWSAPKSPAELEYDSKMKTYESEMKAYQANKKKHDTQKGAYGERHTEVEKLKLALDSAQRNLEKFAMFEPSVPEKAIQAELGLSAFKDAEKGVVSKFFASKRPSSFEKEIKRGLKTELIHRGLKARIPVGEEIVEEEMEAARERRNALKVK